jgi:hypothetical protein
MAKIKDIQLYKKAMAIVYSQYKKPSAYRSGALVKKYKLLYKEKYGNDDAYEGEEAKKNRPLARWYMERWGSVGGDYPTYRPTVRITKDTPKTVGEIPPERLAEQVKLKQKIRGNKNLPPF